MISIEKSLSKIKERNKKSKVVKQAQSFKDFKSKMLGAFFLCQKMRCIPFHYIGFLTVVQPENIRFISNFIVQKKGRRCLKE